MDMMARMPATTMPKPSMEVTIPLREKSSCGAPAAASARTSCCRVSMMWSDIG